MEIESTTKEYEKVQIPENVYSATLKEIKDISKGKNYGEDRVAVIFAVEHEGKEVELSQICGKKISPNTRLGKTILCLGGTITEGTMDVKQLYGKMCRIVVENYKDNDGDTRSGITKTMNSAEEKVE